jgi:hypothetical protein
VLAIITSLLLFQRRPGAVKEKLNHGADSLISDGPRDESDVLEFYSPEAWRQMQAQQAQQTAAPTQQYVPIEQYNALVHRLDELEKWQKSFSKPSVAAKKGE